MRRLVFVAALITLPAGAWAGIGVKVAGGVNMFGQLRDPDNHKAGAGGAAGLLFEIGLNKKSTFGLELGAVYSMRKVTLATGGDGKFTFVEIPIMFKFALGQTFFGGVGGHYASGLSGDFASASQKKKDAGAILSLGLQVPKKGGTRFFLEGRYFFGMTNVDDAGGELKWGGLQLLAGLRFGSK